MSNAMLPEDPVEKPKLKCKSRSPDPEIQFQLRNPVNKYISRMKRNVSQEIQLLIRNLNPEDEFQAENSISKSRS